MILEDIGFDLEYLNKIKSNFSHTSLDKAKNISLINNTKIEVYNFEKAMEIYCKKQRIDKKSTIDAVFCNGETIIFTEFKNTEQIQREDIWKKIYESNIVFLDLCKKRISEIRERLIFCLVYSPKNGRLNLKNEESFQIFADKICEEAHERFPSFNLNRFENFLFGSVFILTKNEFLKKFQIKED